MSRRTAISAESTGRAGVCKRVITFIGRSTMEKRVFSFASLMLVLALAVFTSGVVSAAESANDGKLRIIVFGARTGGSRRWQS